MADQTISALAEELLRRELATNPEQFKPKPFNLGLPDNIDIEMKPISPGTLALIGGLADAATTYNFLKRRTGTESNAILGFTNNHPEATGAMALAGFLAARLANKGIRKLNPKVADAITANLGALQTAYAVGNIGTTRGGQGSSYEYQDKMTEKVINGK
jgi:hypothetical protein